MHPLTSQRLTLPRPHSVTCALLGVTLLLVLLSTAGQLIRYNTPYHSLLGLIDQFYVDNENNIPTYFSGMLLLGGSLLLGLIALIKQHDVNPFRYHWKGLSGLFFLLSVDELASLHEMLIHPVRRYADAGGPFFFGWVLPGLLFAGLVGFSMLRFLWSLPAHTRWGMILAGLIYLAGSLGVEMIGGAYYEQIQHQDLRYSLIVTLEETLEMTGLILFINALLTYLSGQLVSISLQTRASIVTPSTRQTESYAVAA